jgi:hypothetical protein
MRALPPPAPEPAPPELETTTMAPTDTGPKTPPATMAPFLPQFHALRAKLAKCSRNGMGRRQIPDELQVEIFRVAESARQAGVRTADACHEMDIDASIVSRYRVIARTTGGTFKGTRHAKEVLDRRAARRAEKEAERILAEAEAPPAPKPAKATNGHTKTWADRPGVRELVPGKKGGLVQRKSAVELERRHEISYLREYLSVSSAILTLANAGALKTEAALAAIHDACAKAAAAKKKDDAS